MRYITTLCVFCRAHISFGEKFFITREFCETEVECDERGGLVLRPVRR